MPWGTPDSTWIDAVWLNTIDHHVLVSLLEDVGYPLMYVAVNPVVFQLVHDLVTGHNIECLPEVEDGYIHLEFTAKQ